MTGYRRLNDFNGNTRQNPYKATLAWLLIVGTLALLAALFFLARLYWFWVISLSPVSLAAWATIATLAFPLVFSLGYYFGRVEVKGTLQGFDRALDKGYDLMQKTVETRDNSRIRVHQETRQTPRIPTAPYLPDPDFPRFTVRADTDEIIDV